MTRSPLLPIAASFAAGIAAAPHFYLTASEQIALISLAAAAAAVLTSMRRDGLASVVCLWGFLLCGTFFAAAEHAYLPPNHIELLARHGQIQIGQRAEVTGWVRSPSERRPGSEIFDLEATGVRQDGRAIPASGTIRIYYFPGKNHPPSLGVAYGTRLALSLSDLRRPRNFLTPDAFDFESYIHRQGIYLTGLIHGPEDLTVLPGRGGMRWRAAIYRLRESFLASLPRLFPASAGKAEEGAILKAMLLGDDNWLSPGTEAAFQASGTYHVLVVSGWNVFAFAIPLLWLVARLRLPVWLGNSLVAVAVAVFALLAEGGASVTRAALMFVIYLAARTLYREKAALNSIAAAALILLALDPSELWDGGFQLSFFTVLVLAGVAVPLINWIIVPYRRALQHLEDRERDLMIEPAQIQLRDDCRVLLDALCGAASKSSGRRWLRAGLGWSGYGALWVVEGLLFASLIQLGLVLVSVMYFHRVTWSGIFANFLVLPLASGIVLIGLPLLFVSLFWWRAATWGAVLLGWATDLLKWMAQHAARWELLNRRVPAPPEWLAILFLVSLAVFAVLLARHSRWSWAAAMALVALCATLTLAPYSPDLPPGKLELNVIDVGQGDSLFVSFPNGSTMLVDGGGEIPIPGSPPPRMDVGESVISSYLWSRRIQKLDYVVLTHDHWDHMGGLESVLNNFRVGELWLGPDPGDRSMNWLRAIAASRGTRNVQVQAGIKKTIDGVTIEVLMPPVDWAPKRVSNNDSVVLRLGMHDRHYLLAGDVESPMERRLAGSDRTLASDVLKVAHHGSRTSSTAAFLDRVAPQLGIVSVGAFKRFGLPNQEALDRLAAANVRVYRTDLDGTTTVSTDGHRIEVSSYRQSLHRWPRFVNRELGVAEEYIPRSTRDDIRAD